LAKPRVGGDAYELGVLAILGVVGVAGRRPRGVALAAVLERLGEPLDLSDRVCVERRSVAFAGLAPSANVVGFCA
jgi:hypothetical protein